MTAEGSPVMELLSRRESLEKRIDTLNRMAQAAKSMHRYVWIEIK